MELPTLNNFNTTSCASGVDESPPHNKVTILMCTYNGEKYIHEQMESFINQTHSNWELLVSDDGSTDKTHEIIEAYQQRAGQGKIRFQKGPQRGYAANFLSMLYDDKMEGDYFAFSDQDDIWLPDKLEKGLSWLTSIPEDKPALYCTRTQLIDERKKSIGFSTLFTKKPSFSNAMVQNIGGGNTMIFNKKALAILKQSGPHIDVVSHDWWTYLLISGVGGEIYYDSYPSVLYRQHGSNLVGSNTDWLAKFSRIKLLFNNRFRSWIDKNIQALQSVEHLLTADNRHALDQLCKARQQTLIPRIIRLKRSGICRQTFLGNLGLFAGALLRKL